MYAVLNIISIILCVITIITAITGWHFRNNFLQYTSMLSLFFIGVSRFYAGIVRLWNESADQQASALFLGLMSVAIIAGITTAIYCAFETYSAQTQRSTPISLHDFNNYVRLNPTAWDIYQYTLLNKQMDVRFSTSIWEWMIIHFCKIIRVDAQTRAINDTTYQRLSEYVQQDIEEKRRQNQQQMEKSLNAINKSRQTQKDMLESYTQQIQDITKDL